MVSRLVRSHGLLLAVLLLAAFLVATTRYASWTADAPLIGYAASDGASYRAIAEAYPGLPADGAGLVHHHAQRFPVAWAVGGISDALGISVDAAFRVFVVLALAAALAALARALSALGLDRRWAFLLLGLWVLQPVATRFYLTFPWIAPDPACLVGVALLAWGLARDRVGLIVGGVLIASIARQTGLLLVPGVWLWAWLGWRGAAAAAAGGADVVAGAGAGISTRARVAVGALVAVIAGAAYVITDRVAAPFSGANVNDGTITGLFSWLAHHFSAHDLFTFLAHGVVPFVVPLALLAWLLRGADHATRRRVLPLLAVAGLVALQPVLGGPGITGNNLARLAMLGLPALLVTLGVLLAARPTVASLTPAALAIITAALLVASMHHITSLVAQNDSALAEWFGAVTLLCDAAILAVLWRAGRVGQFHVE